MQDVSVKAVPETVVLQRPEEDVAKLLDVPAEQLLLRWVAHHIGAAGPAWEAWLPLENMGPDLADCTALGCLLAQLEPQTASVVNLRWATPDLTCTSPGSMKLCELDLHLPSLSWLASLWAPQVEGSEGSAICVAVMSGICDTSCK